MIKSTTHIHIKMMQTVVMAVCILLSASSSMAQTDLEEGVPVVLAPRHESMLSAEIDSRVAAIGKEFGQSFKKGAMLVRLDAVPAGLGVRRTKTLLAEARKGLKIMEDLFKTKSVSILELEESRSKQVVAEVDLAIARQKLARCAVRAPFTGRVAKLLVNEHEWVKIGTPLMEIVDDSVLLAKFLLPSSMYGNVKINNKVTINIQETGKNYEGEISHIGAEVDPSSRSFEVFAEIKNDGALRSGMRGLIKLP
ncbi:efflux RND transporter periplasmic adaptor subunit [Maridesulfovibrio sp.]|uniref:efflux RND transporter periplasmic adaptor subunit n=1 Tax=Maridesulfovibrio sp. TaxID=2795000 RepID=UPI002AA8B3D1|nr:efflux RND transporter periplasmic adaptor subunit [Maridesulfovibrio sp.]